MSPFRLASVYLPHILYVFPYPKAMLSTFHTAAFLAVIFPHLSIDHHLEYMCVYIYICRRLQSSAFFLQWHVRRRKISKLGTKFSFRQILWREPPLSANQIHLNSYGIHREFRRRSAWKRPNKSSGQTLPRSRFNTLGQGTNFRCIKTTSRSGERSCFNSLLGTNFFFFFFEERIFVTGKNSFSPLIIYGGRKILSFFFFNSWSMYETLTIMFNKYENHLSETGRKESFNPIRIEFL